MSAPWEPGQQVAVAFIAISTCVTGLFDLYAGLRFGETSTISFIILQVARQHPILPLLVGILIGHLFWPQA